MSGENSKVARIKDSAVNRYPAIKQGMSYRVLRIVELTPVIHIEVTPGESLGVIRTDFEFSEG
jgi:hypothetical protein